MTWEVEHIGPHTLYRGDCREVLPTLAPVDAVITDPPYGLTSWNDRGNPRAYRRKFSAETWRRFDTPPSTAELLSLITKARQAIIFGANHFVLPPTPQILVWDKTFRGLHFSDAELAAAYGCKKAVRVLCHQPTECKTHPAQKPLPVMRWIVQFTQGHVLDPYMGSGTTGVACIQLGRIFTGIEIERHYFDLACQRMHDAMAQPDLFIDQAPRAIQQPLFAGGA